MGNPIGWYLRRAATVDDQNPPHPGVWLTYFVAGVVIAAVMVQVFVSVHPAWRWAALPVAVIAAANAAVGLRRFRAARRRGRAASEGRR